MIPTAVLYQPTTTTTAINATHNNTLSSYISNTSVVNLASFFGAFQDTAVGSSELTIRMIVPPDISAKPYRKAMIAILFFRRILSLSSPPSVSLSDLTATVAAYFTLPTCSAERIVDSIRHAFFHVDNLQGIGFLDSSGKLTLVSDIANRAADIVFFTFRSTVTASDIDNCFPSTTLSLDFLLHLPQSVDSTVKLPVFNFNVNNLTPLNVATPASLSSPASRPSLAFALENAMDNVLTSTNAAQLRQFIIDARGPSNLPSNPSPVLTTPKTNRLLLFTSPSISFTPKMDRVRFSGASGGSTTYLGSLDFLDNQRSFDSVFGTTPVMIHLSKRAAVTCAIEDTEYLASKMTNYCDICQLHLFCDIVKLQYVGTETYDTHRMLHDIYLALSDLRLVSKVNGETISLTPDTLYQRFIEFSPLLPPNATSWSFSLVTSFITR